MRPPDRIPQMKGGGASLSLCAILNSVYGTGHTSAPQWHEAQQQQLAVRLTYDMQMNPSPASPASARSSEVEDSTAALAVDAPATGVTADNAPLDETSMHYDTNYDTACGLFTYTRPHNVVQNGAVTLRGLDAEEIAELERLVASGFYTPPLLRDVLSQLNDERSPLPRLRLFDWALTNYAKSKSSVIVRTSDASILDVYSAYNIVLDEMHRKLFDPFRRRGNSFKDKNGTLVERLDKRVWFAVAPSAETVEAAAAAGLEPPPPWEDWTTVAQLVFVRWAITTHVFEYVITNHADIAAHRFAARKARASLNLGDGVSGRKRCRELSAAGTVMRGAVGGTMVLTTTDAE